MPDQSPERQHIYWRRLNVAGQRRKPERKAMGGLPQPPLRPNQRAHGAAISARTAEAFAELDKQRRAVGVDPNQLLVLEMELVNTDQRQALEKLGLQILDEDEIRQSLEVPYYVNVIKFSDEAGRQRFETTVDRVANGITTIKPDRGPAGKPHPLRLELAFTELGLAKAFAESESLQTGFGFKVMGKPQNRSTTSRFRLIVQFPSEVERNRFLSEERRYQAQGSGTVTLTGSERVNLLDAIERVRALIPEDRKGNRLKSEGVPPRSEFAIDVDLWHPGKALLARDMIDDFRRVVTASGGRITDSPYSVAEAMYLTRVKGTAATLDAILQFPHVAVADLPPKLPTKPLTIFDADTNIPPIPPAPDDAPLACVIDSGVVAGHPLLSGWVLDERDFDSGEESPVDGAGHGTYTAGIIVYGDILACIQSGVWEPKVQILSAKVLKNNAGVAV